MVPPVRSTQLLVVVGLLVGLAIAASCGGVGTEDTFLPTGGESCLGDRKICINIKPGALTESTTIRLNTGSDTPTGALSEGFDISATNGKPVKFLIPATVSIRLDIVDANDVPSENLLRIYTRDPDTHEWVALDTPIIDRVRGEITGQTTHLSPFVVLRADRLPDGGFPVEIDGSVPDGSVIIYPPIPDAGKPNKPDAGKPVTDAGQPPTADAGQPGPGDAGTGGPGDAGTPPVDAGTPPVDAGSPPVDAGGPPADAGSPPVDAGSPVDAGGPPVDAGAPADAGGTGPDAGCDDAGGC